jgi:hypothetical protein
LGALFDDVHLTLPHRQEKGLPFAPAAPDDQAESKLSHPALHIAELIMTVPNYVLL